MDKSTLLLFSSEFPCWDDETTKLAGVDPNDLQALAALGELEHIPDYNGYILTSKGLEARDKVSAELYIPTEPCEVLTDLERAKEALERNRLYQLMDHAFVNDWGIKELKVNETFPVVPFFPDNKYFKLEDNQVRALWLDEPLIKDFLTEFPRWGVAARKFPAPDQSELDRWAMDKNAPRGTVTLDLVIRGLHDLEHYSKYPSPVSDRFNFFNKIPMFFHKMRTPDKPQEILPILGKLGIFLLLQRRIYIPGYFDLDSDNQGQWTFFVLVTDTESELMALTETLRTWGQALTAPTYPLYILGTSIERLRNQPGPKQVDTDWFHEETVKILEPELPDDLK